MAEQSKYLREQLKAAIDGRQAHVDFDTAVKDFPIEKAGDRPGGGPHSAWQLLEHMRIAQHDILDFSKNPNYQPLKWPDDYWPKDRAPGSSQAWAESVAAFRSERAEFEGLLDTVADDLYKAFAHGEGQTLLREALLIASHNSYHLGQLMYLRRMLEGS